MAIPTADQAEATFELRHVGRERLSSVVVERLLEGIRSATFPIGASLPAERALAAALGVSRGTVREGVRVLEHAGVLEVRTGSGTFVTRQARSRAAQLRAQAAASGDVSPLDLIAARQALEPACAMTAAARRSQEHVAGLRANVAAQAEAVRSGADSVSIDLDFHILVAEATGSPVLVGLMGQLAQPMREGLWPEVKTRTHQEPGKLAHYLKEHRAVLFAIADGREADARSAMSCHLASVECALLEEFGANDPAKAGDERARRVRGEDEG